MAELNTRRQAIARKALEPDEEDLTVNLDEEAAEALGAGGQDPELRAEAREFAGGEKTIAEAAEDRDLSPRLYEAYMRRLGYKDGQTAPPEAAEESPIHGEPGAVAPDGDPYTYEKVDGGYRIASVDLSKVSIDPERAKRAVGAVISEGEFRGAQAGGAAELGTSDTSGGTPAAAWSEITEQYQTSSMDEPDAPMGRPSIPEYDETSVAFGGGSNAPAPPSRLNRGEPTKKGQPTAARQRELREMMDTHGWMPKDALKSGATDLGDTIGPPPGAPADTGTSPYPDDVFTESAGEASSTTESPFTVQTSEDGQVSVSGSGSMDDLSALLADLFAQGQMGRANLDGVQII